MSKEEEKQKRYPNEFKVLVVETVLKEHLSLKEGVRRFGISCPQVIRSWIRVYENEGASALLKERRGRHKKPRREAPPRQNLREADRESLENEIKYLRAENDYLKKLRALVLEEERQNKSRTSSRN